MLFPFTTHCLAWFLKFGAFGWSRGVEVWFLLWDSNLSIWISSWKCNSLHSSPQGLSSHVCRTMGALTGWNAKPPKMKGQLQSMRRTRAEWFDQTSVEASWHLECECLRETNYSSPRELATVNLSDFDRLLPQRSQPAVWLRIPNTPPILLSLGWSGGQF